MSRQSNIVMLTNDGTNRKMMPINRDDNIIRIITTNNTNSISNKCVDVKFVPQNPIQSKINIDCPSPSKQIQFENDRNLSDNEYYRQLFGRNIGPLITFEDFLKLENRSNQFYMEEYRILTEVYGINMDISEKLLQLNEAIKDKSSVEGMEITKRMTDHTYLLSSQYFQLLKQRCLELQKLLFN